MNDEQLQAILTELRGLRKEVRSTRFAARLTACLLLGAALAVMFRYEWFGKNFGLGVLIAGGAFVILTVIFHTVRFLVDFKVEESDSATPASSSLPTTPKP